MVQQTQALFKIAPSSNEQLMAFWTDAIGLRNVAVARIILTNDDLKPATDDLSLIAKIKRGMEECRKEYLKPFQDHIKETNDAYKTLMEPIETADKITRDKILAFRAEQERKRREQERINQLRLDAAKAEMELKGELTESVNLVEVLPETPKRISTELGTVGQRDNWKWEIVDINQVPREYLMINVSMLTPIIKASKGKLSIPGIRIYNAPILAVNT